MMPIKSASSRAAKAKSQTKAGKPGAKGVMKSGKGCK